MKIVSTCLLAVLLLLSPSQNFSANSASAATVLPATALQDSSGGDVSAAHFLSCLARCTVKYQTGLASCTETCPDLCLLKIVLIGCVIWTRNDACWEACVTGHHEQFLACHHACAADPFHDL